MSMLLTEVPVGFVGAPFVRPFQGNNQWRTENVIGGAVKNKCTANKEDAAKERNVNYECISPTKKTNGGISEYQSGLGDYNRTCLLR
jgi:hypothetical protein